MQIKLLNKGLIIPAMEVQSIMMELVSKYSCYENIPEESTTPLDEYKQLANDSKCNFISLLYMSNEVAFCFLNYIHFQIQ